MGKPQKKTRNPGVGVDFKRVKHKVGKKLPKARNETDTDFKSRSINLPNQAVKEDRSNIAVNYQNLTLKELLNQTSHHNDKARKHSLVGLADLFGRHPEQLHLHAAQVLATLAERIVDGDSAVRSALRELLNTRVLPLLGPDALRPFLPVVMAHVCGAMTHLSLDVRTDALLFLDVLMEHVPRLVAEGFLAPCLAHFCDLFSAAHRGRSIRSQSLTALTKLLTALTAFLRRAFPQGGSAAGGGPRAPAEPAGTDTEMGAEERGGDGAAAAAAAAAGPGPSSVRQQMKAVAAAAAVSLAARPGAPLGVDRLRRPPRSAGVLLRQLDELFRAAAAVSRAGRKQRGKAGAAAAAEVLSADKNRHKKGRGSISMTETAASAAAGKGVAAAAAALAAVTAPTAATAAGMDLSAPSGSAAANVLGTSSAMAAALAAASDARASALRLVSLLLDCWLECDPALLATAPELEQVNALAMIATACNCLIERLLLPRQEQQQQASSSEATAGVTLDGRWEQQQQQQGSGPPPPPQLAEQRLALAQQLHDVAARRVAAHFPAVLPPVKPPPAVVEALVRLNLQSAELLGRFLPLLASQTRTAAAAAGGGGAPEAAAVPSLPWASSLVSYYVGALEQGQLLPPAAGKLSDASGAAAAAQGGLTAAVADTVLAAVAAALQHLDDTAAARLMAAVGQFAARQPPRSGSRLACVRMQHSLLRAAVDGRLFLADGVVSSWLEPLPKLLWEAGGSGPDVSAAALTLIMDAARFAAPGSSMCEFLGSTLQPQLGPLFAVQMPPKAAKAAAAAAKAAAAPKGAPQRGPPGAEEERGEEEEVMVLLPGPVAKLPDAVAGLAVDLVYHTGPLGGALLKALAATLSSALLPGALALRLLDVALARLRDAPDPALAASWLLTLLFGPQHGARVLSPQGADLTPPWSRQRALADAAVMGLGRLGGAAPLLLVLAAPLAMLPLTDVATAGARGARMQRYSLVRLCAAALAEAAGGDGLQRLPEAMAAALPAAAALCGVEAGAAAAAAAAAEQGSAAAVAEALPYRSTFGPVVQLLTERPDMATAVVRHVAALLREATPAATAVAGVAGGGCAHAVGHIPLHTAALAALQLAQAVVKLPPVRSVVVGSAAERQALGAAVQELSGAVRGLPAGGADPTASCELESQRLTQMVADLYGSKAIAA